MPAERLKIGIVGLRFGKHIADTLRAPPASDLLELAALCDMDAARCREVAAPLGLPAFDSLDALLSESGIPAIGLFTGPAGRADLIRRCVRAGKHVMTTKPLELDADAALAVLEEAAALGRAVHLNSPAPVLPDDLRQIIAWRNEHDLGRPVGARADVWASYRERPDGSWYDDPARCPAAPIYRLGIYLINDLVTLFGAPRRVTLLESRLRTGRPTADNAQLGIEFACGAIANVFASFCVEDGDHYRNGLTLNYENGTIYRNVGPERGGAAAELSLVRPAGGRRQCVARAAVAGASGEYRWDLFCRAARGERLDGALAAPDLVAGVRVIRMMMAEGRR
jgi:predicted dehydrogenase